jgi:hypothetical protein
MPQPVYQIQTVGEVGQMNRMRVLTVAAGAVLFSSSSLAHHSFAAFEQDKVLSLSGTVKDWQWTNPHTWLILEVPSESGAVEEWSIEGQSPQVLRREQGISRDIMKAGDKVVVKIHPRRDGSHGGSFMSVAAADGHELGQKP